MQGCVSWLLCCNNPRCQLTQPCVALEQLYFSNWSFSKATAWSWKFKLSFFYPTHGQPRIELPLLILIFDSYFNWNLNYSTELTLYIKMCHFGFLKFISARNIRMKPIIFKYASVSNNNTLWYKNGLFSTPH